VHPKRAAAPGIFPAVCTRLAQRFAAPPLARSSLAVDQTAVGKPVLDLLRQAQLSAQLKPITVTAGRAAAPNERAAGWCPSRTW
jgi:hypothetical protein